VWHHRSKSTNFKSFNHLNSTYTMVTNPASRRGSSFTSSNTLATFAMVSTPTVSSGGGSLASSNSNPSYELEPGSVTSGEGALTSSSSWIDDLNPNPAVHGLLLCDHVEVSLHGLRILCCCTSSGHTILWFLKVICHGKILWQAHHTGIHIVPRITAMMGCAVHPRLRNFVKAITYDMSLQSCNGSGHVIDCCLRILCHYISSGDSILLFVKAVCHSKKSWQGSHTSICIIQ
jgi:hypothetical protein